VGKSAVTATMASVFRVKAAERFAGMRKLYVNNYGRILVEVIFFWGA